MKLIIEIPQEVYDHARSMSQDGQDEAQAMRAIANGKVSFCRWLSTDNVKQACIDGPCEREKITNPCIECGGNACRAIMDGKTCNAMYYSAQPHGECNQCRYYEGVHGVQGHAPCSFWKIGGVLWNDYCSRYKKEGEAK